MKAETSEESGSEQESERGDLSSSEDEIDDEVERANAWRLQTLSVDIVLCRKRQSSVFVASKKRLNTMSMRLC